MQTSKLFFTLLFLLAFTACKTEYPGQEPKVAGDSPPVPVKVVDVDVTTAPLPIEVGGTIGSKQEARLSFKIGGIIASINTEEGRYVRRGQVLARLKGTEIDAQVMKARQARDQRQRDLDRVKRLYADSAATLEMVQQLETGLEVAESDLEIASFNRDYAKIVSPITGRVVKRLAERGELIGPGSPVFVIAGEGSSSYVLRVGVADRHVLSLAEGDSAEVRLDAFPEESVAATVTEIAAAADPRTGTFEIELTLDGRGKTLRNGFIGRASIYPSRTPPHVRLPMDALADGSGNRVTIYYPVSGGQAQALRVRLQRLLDDSFVVPAADLEGIERVITTGAAYLSEGTPIDIH